MDGLKNKFGSKPLYITVGIAVVLVAGFFIYRAVSSNGDPTEIYRTARADYAVVSRTVGGSARIETGSAKSLFAQSSQTVVRVAVREGDMVSAGQVLVEYDIEKDAADLNRSLAEAKLYLENALLSLQDIARPVSGNQLLEYEAQVTAAEKAVSDTQGEIDSLLSRIKQQKLRVENLADIAGVDEDDDDDYDGSDADYTNYRVAKAGLSDLRAQLETKENALEFQEKQLADAEKKLQNARDPLSDEAAKARYSAQENIVRINRLAVERIEENLAKLESQALSPVDGYVSAVYIVEGESVSSGLEIMELAAGSGLTARFEAGEYDTPMIELGQRARITSGGFPGVEFSGRVTRIYSHAIEKTGSDDEMIVPVEISLDAPADGLRAGYTVDVEIYVSELPNVLAVPIQALSSDADGSFVYLIRNGAVHKRPVTAGLYGDSLVEITEGLSQGDVVALDYGG